MKTTHATLTLALLGSTLSTGCRDQNNRLTLGGNTNLHTFTEPSTPTQPSTQPSTTPTTSLSRDTWRPTQFVVPVDGTVHAPTWVTRRQYTEGTPRQVGLMPTPDTALDTNTDGSMMFFEALTAPFIATLDVALMPIRLFTASPTSDTQSPSEVYKRSVQGGWMTGWPAEPTQPEASPQDITPQDITP